MASNAYSHVFNDVGAFPGNITIDLIARYAAAFGAMEAGKLLQKAFLEKKNTENDYEVDFFPSMSDFYDNPKESHEYVKLEVAGVDALEFGSVMTDDDGAVLAPPLLINFSQEKSLIETMVNDADPVVVERWGTKPWEIKIKGILIDVENRIYPTDRIRKLSRAWQVNDVISVAGVQFEERDIDSIYFKSIAFNVVEGYQDTIQFSIDALSIKAVNYDLAKPND